jgi:hypothetical protein
MFVSCECCVLSGRGLCDGLITRPEESYWLWCVVACDQEISKTRRLNPATGLCKIQPRWVVTPGKQTNTLYGRWKKIGLGLIWTAISDLMEKIIKPPKKSQRELSFCV